MPIRPSGPAPASIMLVGEAPGEQEEEVGMPFVGKSGQELARMCKQAGIDFFKTFRTNVFMIRPPGNKIDLFCGKKAEVGGKDYPYIPFGQGKYFKRELIDPELDRLREEIARVKPDLIIALGNTPCWALIGRTGINKLRGSIFPNFLVPDGPPIFATFHPSYILRAWSERVICVADLMKAKRYVEEGFHVPRRELWLAPTIEEVRRFTTDFILDPWARREYFGPLGFDVETKGGTVTCIGFAPTKERAITIPFYDPQAPDKNYWRTFEEEKEAHSIVREILESDIPKVGQNGLYDVQYCYRWQIKVRKYLRDTMIRHHALEPEMAKGLGFLATLYTDEAPWKVLRDRNKDNFKLEDE